MIYKVLWLVLAILFPPITVALLEGFGFHFFLNVLLWICGVHIGGAIHACYIVLTRKTPLPGE